MYSAFDYQYSVYIYFEMEVKSSVKIKGMEKNSLTLKKLKKTNVYMNIL